MKTTPGHVFELLALHPYPGAKDVALDAGVLTFTVNGVKVCLDDGWHVGAWRVSDRIILSRLSPYSALDKLTLHTEIARVLRLAAEASPRESRVYLDDPSEPDPPVDDPLYDRATAGQALARVTAERDAARARADTAEANVKRLLRQRRAAHDVLDEAGIGLEEEGSPRWTLARRCRAAVEPVWDHLDAVHALDEIAKLCGLTAPSLSTGATDSEVIAAVKTLAADAGFYRLDRPAYLEANQARERIAAHLRLPGATLAQLADAIVAPKPSHLHRVLARLAR